MQGTTPGGYRGFRTTGAIMRHLARLDVHINGAVRVPGDGRLGQR